MHVVRHQSNDLDSTADGEVKAEPDREMAARADRASARE
jgi:hypothetical protein